MDLFNLCRWLLLAGLCLSLPVKAEPKWQPPADIASAFLLTVNGKALWQSQADQRLPPASLTKLVAALVIVDNPKLDSWVTISKQATKQDGTTLHLKPNEQFRAAYLLGAMLIKSANDACAALAEWDAGSEKAFVVKMNAKVQKLGLKNTHFTNPCGFDHPQHYSSANDLMQIARVVNDQPKIKIWTDMLSFTLESKAGKKRDFIASNLLLGRVEGVDGLKTGYTKKAGKCLIAHGKRNQKEVFLVMLNAPDRWWDADGMLNRVFDEDY